MPATIPPVAAAHLMQSQSNGKAEMPIACERCRRRKQRCDRKLPSCGNCLKSGHQCNAPDVTDRRRNGTTQTARLPKGYIEQLEAQVRYLESSMEEKLATLRASGRSDLPPPPSPQPIDERRTRGDSMTPSKDPTSSGGPMDIDHEDGSSSTGPIRQASVTTNGTAPNASGSRDSPLHDASTLPTMSILSLSNIGDSSETGPFTFSKVLSTIIRTDGRNPALASKVNPFFTDLADAIPHVLPDMASQISGKTGRMHLDKYFRIIQFRYPCLDQMEVEAYYQAWLERQSRKNEETGSEGVQTPNTTTKGGGGSAVLPPESPVKNFIIYMVLAIGITLNEDSATHSSFFSNHFLFAAIRHFEAVLEGSETNMTSDDPIDTIRALLLLAIYSLYSPSAGPSWHFIGLAVRKAICLGYHMEVPPGAIEGGEEVREKRRWVFWSCYVLDRCICQALGRPLGIQDGDVTAKFPSPGKNQTDPFSIHFMRYNLLRTDLMRHPHKDFTYHFTNLVHWRACTPHFPPNFDPRLRETISDYFDGVYWTAFLLFVAPKRCPSSITPASAASGTSVFPNPLSPTEHRKLSHIAFASIYVLRSAAKRVEGSYFVSWLVGYRVFKAGLIFLRSVLQLSSFRRRYCTVEQVSSDMGCVMDVLTAVGTKFDELKKYRAVFRVLKRGFEKFLEAEKMGLRPPVFLASDVEFGVVTLGALRELLEEVVDLLVVMSAATSMHSSGNTPGIEMGGGMDHGHGGHGGTNNSTPLPGTPSILAATLVPHDGGAGGGGDSGGPFSMGSTTLPPLHMSNITGFHQQQQHHHHHHQQQHQGGHNSFQQGIGGGGGGGGGGWGSFGAYIPPQAPTPDMQSLQDKELYEILFGTGSGL